MLTLAKVSSSFEQHSYTLLAKTTLPLGENSRTSCTPQIAFARTSCSATIRAARDLSRESKKNRSLVSEDASSFVSAFVGKRDSCCVPTEDRGIQWVEARCFYWCKKTKLHLLPKNPVCRIKVKYDVLLGIPPLLLLPSACADREIQEVVNSHQEGYVSYPHAAKNFCKKQGTRQWFVFNSPIPQVSKHVLQQQDKSQL